MRNLTKQKSLKRNRNLIFISILTLFNCCKNSNDWAKINGEWVNFSSNLSEGTSILISNGYFEKTFWNGDVVNKSKGKCFLNKNPKRETVTLAFLPDLQIINNDTFFAKCECIDIVYVKDSSMCLKLPSKRVNFNRLYSKIINDYEIYIKKR